MGSLAPIVLVIQARSQVRARAAELEKSWHANKPDDGVYPEDKPSAGDINKSMETSRAIARRASSKIVDGQKFWGIVSNFNKREADYLFNTLLCAYDELGYKPLTDSLHEAYLKHFDDGAVLEEQEEESHAKA